MEDRSLRTLLKASGQFPRRTNLVWRGLHQSPRQHRSKHAVRPADVSDHWSYGGIRASLDSRASPRGFAKCPRQRKATGKAAGDRGQLQDRLPALSGLLLGADYGRNWDPLNERMGT